MSAVKLKTYERKNTTVDHSFHAINALFAKNLKQRLKSKPKRNKIVVKELPKRVKTYLDNESFKLRTEDSFDKLRNGANFNNVNVVNSVKNLTSSSDLSISAERKEVSFHFHSPVITRGRRRNKLVEMQNTSSVSSNLGKQSSLDKPVDVSLEVEHVNKTLGPYTLSYIKLPEVKENEIPQVCCEISSNQCLDGSFYRSIQKNIFASTPLLATSTPLVSHRVKDNLLKKSYEEIKKWDSQFPMDANTSKSPSKLRESPISPPFSGYPVESLIESLEKRESLIENSNLIQSSFKQQSPKPKTYITLRRRQVPLTKLRKSKTEVSESSRQFKNSESDYKSSTCEEFSKSTNCDSVSNTSEQTKNNIINNKCNLVVNLSKHDFGPTVQNSETKLDNSKVLRTDFVTKRKTSKKSCRRRDTICVGDISSRSVFNDYSDGLKEDSKKSQEINSIIKDLIVLLDKHSFHSNDLVSKDLRRTQPTVLLNRVALPNELEKSHGDLSAAVPNLQSETANEISTVNEEEDNNHLHQSSLLQSLVQENPTTQKTVNDPVEEIELPDIIELSDTELDDDKTTMKTIQLINNLQGEPLVDNITTWDLSHIEEVNESTDIIETSLDFVEFPMPLAVGKKKPIYLKPGKCWRRSFADYKRNSFIIEKTSCLRDCKCQKCGIRRQTVARRSSIRVVPVSSYVSTPLPPSISILENYAHVTSNVSHQLQEETVTDNFKKSLRRISQNKSSKKSSLIRKSLCAVSAREIVLKRCGQQEPLPFQECYTESMLQNCHKIGEGVYGEVFLYRNETGATTVMKVIPIEGDQTVNGERQKKFDEIISEIIISGELSNLRNNEQNTTSAFSEVQRIRCVKGCYPARLLELWELFDETRGSENDSPDMFTSEQLYIVLELANGGKDLESFVFRNAEQAYSMFEQVAYALAVAEGELHFEHRDLHWGNVLLSTVDKKKLNFRLNDKNIEISTNGIEVCIIDFTLSRMEYQGVIFYNDLRVDPDLFTAEGDYQFDIYRLMQRKNGNDWKHFEPHSNILWLHYILDKAISSLRYKNKTSKVHKQYIQKINDIKECILSYGSVKEFVLHNIHL